MSILSWAIVAFLVMETMNIVILYWFPGSKLGNGVGVFNAWEASKAHPEVHALVRYLTNWVAGTKLIFVALLVVILLQGDPDSTLAAVVALILSILSFFWRLFPAVLKIDREGGLTPQGYSRTLGAMITGILLVFSIVLAVSLVVR